MLIEHAFRHGTHTISPVAAAEYLQRVGLAMRYAVGSRSSIATTLLFAVRTLLDVIDARTASVWICREDGAWECLAAVAEGPPLPTDFKSWDSLNLRAVHAGGVLDVAVATEEEPHLHHFATASIWSGYGFQVLHVLASVPEEEVILAHRFLDVMASLLLTQEMRLGGPSSNGQAKHPATKLTERQRAILTLMATPKPYRQIAAELGYSESTVKQEAGRIFEHFGVTDRAAAVRAANLPQPSVGNTAPAGVA